MEPSGRKFNDMELDHNKQPHNPLVYQTTEIDIIPRGRIQFPPPPLLMFDNAFSGWGRVERRRGGGGVKNCSYQSGHNRIHAEQARADAPIKRSIFPLSILFL
jgi:hypothetical protein